MHTCTGTRLDKGPAPTHPLPPRRPLFHYTIRTLRFASWIFSFSLSLFSIALRPSLLWLAINPTYFFLYRPSTRSSSPFDDPCHSGPIVKTTTTSVPRYHEQCIGFVCTFVLSRTINVFIIMRWNSHGNPPRAADLPGDSFLCGFVPVGEK